MPFISVKAVSRDICAIDQFDAKDFSTNECGWQMSDISKLARAQSLSEYEAIMKRIGQNPAQYNITEDMTIEQALSMVKPRNCQSPAELMRFVDSLPYDAPSLDDAYKKAVPDVSVVQSPDAPDVDVK